MIRIIHATLGSNNRRVVESPCTKIKTTSFFLKSCSSQETFKNYYQFAQLVPNCQINNVQSEQLDSSVLSQFYVQLKTSNHEAEKLGNFLTVWMPTKEKK